MKKLTVFLITIILSLIIATNVNAVEDIELKSTKDRVNLGEEIVVSLDLNLNDNKEESLYAYTAKLSYDKDVFEVIDESNFEESENWSDITYNKNNNKFALINKKGEANGNILQIKLKVKESATPGNTTITVNSITASDGERDIQIEGKTIDIMVIKDGLAEEETIPLSKTNEVVEDTTNIEVGKDYKWIAYILIAIIIVIFILTIYYYLSSKEKNTPQNKRTIIIGISIVILILLITITINLLINKKADVNKDSQVDYDDTKDIIEYLLEIKKPEENEDLSDKDINKDGQITIRDVAAATKQATNQKYIAKINGTTNNNNNNNGKNTNNQKQPSNPNNPSNPNEPSNPSQPSNPNEPSNPSQPSNPNEPSNPNQPDNPNEPSIPTNPNNPNESSSPNQPTKPEYSTVLGNTTVSNYTPKKGEEITIDLYIDVTPYTEIEAVEIDGKSYKVTKIENSPVKIASIMPIKLKTIATNINEEKNNHYSVTVPVSTKAGVQDIHITKVELDNGKKINVDYSVKVDVLKDAPKIKDFYINDKTKVPEISFYLEDPDGALKNAKFTITDKNGNVVLSSEDIKVGNNTFRVDLIDETIYHYDLEAQYDLDHDYFDNNVANNHEENIDFMDSVIEDKKGDQKFTRKYNFIAKNMNLTPEVSVNDELILSFENGAESYYDVTHITINNIEYRVENKNGKYTVKLPKGEKGSHTITVNSVKLENGNTFPVNQTFSYTYLKDKPTIEDLETEFKDGIFHVNVPVKDIDNTIRNMEIIIKNQTGNVIKSENLNKNTDNNSYSKDIEIDLSGTITIEVEITYDLGNGKELKLTQTYTKTLQDKPIEASIKKEESIINKYAHRGETVDVTYAIEDNTDKELTHITINGVKISATKLDDGKYKVAFKLPNDRPENGKATIIATELYYQDEVEPIKVNCEIEIEILKNEPTIEDLFINDLAEKPELEFKLIDTEDTFISGKLIITNEDGSTAEEIEMSSNDVEKDIQKYTLENIEQSKKYNLSIEATYDLDNDKLNSDNQYTKAIKTHEFKIEKDYEFTLSDFKFIKIENDNVILQFTSTNKQDDVEKVEISLNENKREYKVEKAGNIYTIKIPLADMNNTRTELKLEEVILKNLKEFNSDTEQELFESLERPVVFKNAPTATIGDITVNDDKTEINVKDINIEDTDSTITSKSIILKLDNEIIDKIALNDQKEVTFSSVNKETYKAGNYKIEVIADYDARDGKEHKDEVISKEEKNVTVNIDVKITDVSEKIYAEKGSTAKITFTIKSNTTQDITNIKLNTDSSASFEKGNDGIYTITVNVPNNSGLISYKITEITYGTELPINIENSPTAEVYVLKDVPTISEVIFDDINQPHTYTFTFNDSDETVIDQGKINITYQSGAESQETLVANESNQIVLTDLTDANPVTLTFVGKYDRDDVKNDGINEYNLSNLLEPVVLNVIKYTISLKDLKIEKVDQENNEVTITFGATNNTTYDITDVKLGDEYYQVTKEGDKYKVTIPYTKNNEGRAKITISEVKVSNGKTVSLENDLTFEFLKKAPTAEISEISKNENQIIAKFTITDEDNTILPSGLTAELRDETEKIIESKEIEKENTEVTFDCNIAGTYKVIITADYDIIDLKNHTNEQLAESEELNIPLNAKITNSVLNKYPVKNETMTIKYQIEDNSDKLVTAVELNDNKVDVSKTDDGYYTVQYTAPEISGKKEIKVSKLYYDNKEITLEKVDEIDVLKTVPTVADFKVNVKGDKAKATFNITDTDSAFTDGKIIILNKEDNSTKEILLEKNESGIKNEYDLSLKELKQYEINLQINYDLDSDIGNDNVGKIELKAEIEEVTNNDRAFEMKDIQNVYLYKKSGTNVDEIYTVSTTDLQSNLNSYLVKVQMKDMPDFYTTIKNYMVQDNKLKFELEYDNITQYDGNNGQNKLVVTYGDMNGTTAKNKSFASLLKEMNDNPYGNFELTQDYDASGFDGDKLSQALVNNRFSGNFNGNGHTIYNLSKPLFNELSGGSISNLILKDVLLSTEGANKGSLANIVSGTTITNVHVKNVRITTHFGKAKYGAIVGDLNNSATIKECSASDINITGVGTKVGGLVGSISDSTVNNCYAIGDIENTNNSAAKGTVYVGGIAGYIDDCGTIENCISKINLNVTQGPEGNGGILGSLTTTRTVKLTGNISLSTGSNAYKIYGADTRLYITFKQNYEMTESTLIEEDREIDKVSKNELTSDFFTNKLDLYTWNFDNVSYDKLPTLRNNDPNNNKNDNQEEKGTNIYIPDVERLKAMSEYHENKQIAYSNLYKIMPFYDSKYLVLDGNKIDEKDILNTEIIKTVLAYDKNHNLLVSLKEENENYKDINSIRVVFESGKTKEYDVTFKDFHAHVASYTIDELNIEYNYNKYIINNNAQIVDDLINYIKTLDYTRDLEKIADIEYGKRIYKDYFEKTTKTRAEEFVLNYLDNVKGNSVTIENDVLNAVIKNKLIDNDKLKNLMFAYNYYSRWYSSEVNGAKIADMMLFKEELYSNNMGIDNLTNEMLASRWRSSNHTKYFYRDNIAHRTGIATIGSFIDYNVDVLGNFETRDDWFTKEFKGILVEVPAKGHPDIDYRAWTQLKKQDTYLLPILTLPENAGYMLSTPTQFIVGSQRVYIDNPEDPSQREKLLNDITDYGTNYMGVFYTTAAGFIEPKYMNGYADIHMDTPKLKNGTLQQEKTGTTQDPFNINFFEAMEDWPTILNSGAYAQDGKVHWVTYSAMNKNAYSGVWSHESAHNQAVKLFLKDNGRRPSGNVKTIDEDYPDGNISQGFGDGDVNFNLTYNFPVDAMITTNLTTERIDSKDKIEDYYKKMFQTIDFLDYIEAQAFLKLTPEEQSKVCVQATVNGGYVRWNSLTKEQLTNMGLHNMNDIYANKIMINPGSNGTLKTPEGAYGAEGMYIRRWYQPHNDSGRTYSHGLKYTAWQMLGEGGYDNGYITYYSGKSNNDLEAIQKVTGNPNMTWEKYKLDRYNLIGTNYMQNAYLDTSKLINEYEQALKEDAQNNDQYVTKSTNVRRNYYHYLKRVTNDFREDVLTNNAKKIHITDAQDFYDKISKNPMGYYVLDNNIDFSQFDKENVIIDGCFAGKLEGNNHIITGNKVPIFNNIKFARITDLKIESSNITSSEKSIGALAKTMSYVEMENVEANNITINSAQEEIGGLVGFVEQSKIKKVKMNNVNISNTTTKVGSLAGRIENSSIEDVTINKSTISASSKEIGGIVGVVAGTKINNMHITDATVSGNNRVGGLIGYIGSMTIEDKNSKVKQTITSTIDECSSNAEVISTQNATGGLIGEVAGATAIQNSFSLGKVKGASDIGGLIGYLDGSSVMKCFSAVTATGTSGVSGFVGQAKNNSTVQDNIALGNQNNANKFDGRTNSSQLSNYSNNYEYEENSGNSLANNASFNGKIKVATKEEVTSKEFYISTLKWDDTIWDFDNIQNEVTPTLKCSKLNKSVNIIEKYNINNANEFIEQLTAHPNATFNITNDIDFSEKTYEKGSSVISEAFKGKINGNNYTIKNLENASLFEQFDGKVSNLNISNFKYGVVMRSDAVLTGQSDRQTDNIGSFAKKSNNAVFSKMKFEKIIMFGKSNLGIVVAEDTNSTFEQISVKEAYVYGNGNNVSTFIGTKNGGIIRNCYVQGELRDRDTTANNIAGIMGQMNASQNKVIVENTISNIYINTDVKVAAGFVGTITNGTQSTIKNSAFIGSGVVSKYTDFYNFTTSSEDIIKSTFSNCYENGESLGKSNANETNIVSKPKANLLDKDFYTQTLNLDEKIWDLQNVQQEKDYPRLKTGSDIKTISIIDIDLIL